MSKPENGFIAGVHKYLSCYAEKTNNPYRGGTPDVYYSGKLDTMWIEYKFVVLPKRSTTIIVPDLSPLQLDWLRGRGAEGRDVHVVVGCKEGACIFPTFCWERGMSAAKFREQLMSRKELAAWIDARVGPRAC